MTQTDSIAFLATGSELTQGEVINSNAPNIAQALVKLGLPIGMHLTCQDDFNALLESLRFLLKHHKVVITIGGLGPTSDDITRDAVAEVLGRPLEFVELSWVKIEQIFAKRNLPLTDNNRQQAYFPQTAMVLDNLTGSADGCVVDGEGVTVIMLPGPPGECLPMVAAVAKVLLAKGLGQELEHFVWRMMGYSESKLAAEIDPIAERLGFEPRYRASYPYLDLKVALTPKQDRRAILAEIEPQVTDYWVAREAVMMSEVLKEKLSTFASALHIYDSATRGALFAAIQPYTLPGELELSLGEPAGNLIPWLSISGFVQYWQGEASGLSAVNIESSSGFKATIDVPLRGEKTMAYAVEALSIVLLREYGACFLL